MLSPLGKLLSSQCAVPARNIEARLNSSKRDLHYAGLMPAISRATGSTDQ